MNVAIFIVRISLRERYFTRWLGGRGRLAVVCARVASVGGRCRQRFVRLPRWSRPMVTRWPSMVFVARPRLDRAVFTRRVSAISNRDRRSSAVQRRPGAIPRVPAARRGTEASPRESSGEK